MRATSMPETIEQLATDSAPPDGDFLAGEAAIDPKNGRKTCRNSYCELQPLCRIDELEQRQKDTTAGRSS